MPLFQDFGKRVSEVAKNVGQKTAEATEVARLNNRIAGKEAEIEQLLLQIGKAYYSMRGAGGAFEAADMFCQKVKSLEEECAAMRNEIDALRHQSRCPNCGGVQPVEASFCASCGTKLPKPVKPEPTPEPEPAPEPETAPESEPEPDVTTEPELPSSMTAGSAEIIWPAPAHVAEAPAETAPADEAPTETAPADEAPTETAPAPEETKE